MPTDTPDQQITMPVDADTADNPVAFASAVGDFEHLLVRHYTDEADRTTRMLTLVENDISTLGTENRAEIYNGSAHISLYTRSLFLFTRKTAVQNVGPSNTTLQNVTDMVATLPGITGAIFGWRSTVFYDGDGTADIKFAHTIPAGATMTWAVAGFATNSIDPVFSGTTVSGTAIALGAIGVGSTNVALIEGEITMGATAGNLQLQAAQNTSTAAATNVQARSRMEVWRIS